MVILVVEAGISCKHGDFFTLILSFKISVISVAI